MTEHERDAMRAEDHRASQQSLAIVKALLEGQKEDRRISAERFQAHDARITRIEAENSQQNREMHRDAKEVAKLRGEVLEGRQAMDSRFDGFEHRLSEIAKTMRGASPAIMTAIVAVVVAFMQFVVPALIEKLTP